MSTNEKDTVSLSLKQIAEEYAKSLRSLDELLNTRIHDLIVEKQSLQNTLRDEFHQKIQDALHSDSSTLHDLPSSLTSFLHLTLSPQQYQPLIVHPHKAGIDLLIQAAHQLNTNDDSNNTHLLNHNHNHNHSNPLIQGQLTKESRAGSVQSISSNSSSSPAAYHCSKCVKTFNKYNQLKRHTELAHKDSDNDTDESDSEQQEQSKKKQPAKHPQKTPKTVHVDHDDDIASTSDSEYDYTQDMHTKKPSKTKTSRVRQTQRSRKRQRTQMETECSHFCPHCNKGYRSKQGMTAHIKSKHPMQWKKRAKLSTPSSAHTRSPSRSSSRSRSRSRHRNQNKLKQEKRKKSNSKDLPINVDDTDHEMEDVSSAKNGEDHVVEVKEVEEDVDGEEEEEEDDKVITYDSDELVRLVEEMDKDGELECPQCHKSFERKYMLRQHLIVHSDKKPYVCDWCSRAYKRQCSLDLHQRQHCKQKPVESEMNEEEEEQVF
eukprot:CAMPEP_0197037230 /NCGR_PEP_ID=MMETSP1384-20130603/14488_1 /TAXON_ID=29189 /ORGANISM="Ammonia sp." /LENGTH=486 /DNA_ID=CAMNT_0042467501 /DNA_START=46 /DNA_END=1506 /DNA_ORIENTATION=+